MSAPLLARFVYPYPVVLAVVMAGLAGAGFGGERLLRRHVDRVTDRMEFVV